MKVSITDPRLRPLPADADYDRLTRGELIVLLRAQAEIGRALERQLQAMQEELVEVQGAFFKVVTKIYAPSSEKSPRPRCGGAHGSPGRKHRQNNDLLPSERYPDAEIVEKHISYETLPHCACCGGAMTDSGMTEVSEYLEVIPKKFRIVRQHRHKYRCSGCHGSVVTTPGLPRIVPGSAYGDDIIIDAALSKYCDLIPMHRYVQMAARQGFPGLPPNSLIGLTIMLATYLKGVYEAIRHETLQSPVLLADETPHRMLEGDEKSGWFLWGFLGSKSCFYECHGTRSGDVATEVLARSQCEVLLTDVYSGYRKAVREANALRLVESRLMIIMAYCNSHARRGFKFGSSPGPADAEYMLAKYAEIYALEKAAKEGSPDLILDHRAAMKPLFAAMHAHATTKIDEYSSKSALGKAFAYFLSNYSGLTYFLEDPRVPIDNNASERGLRSHVIGRKTWYGTHSRAGAEAAAMHFSIVESCKLIGVNPRVYYPTVIKRLHAGQPPLTPSAFLAEQRNSS